MKIILVDEQSGRRRTLKGSSRSLVGVTLLGVSCLLALGGWSGWQLGALKVQAQAPERLASLSAEVAAQQQELEAVKAQAQLEVDALTLRLGELQGRMLRIDALGERLTDVAKLDAEEFRFDQPPAVGGPETDDLERPWSEPSINGRIDELLNQLDQRQLQLQVLENLLRSRQIEDDVAIAGRPVEKGWLSSPFGRRSDPFTGRPAWHKGVDFAGKEGSNVVAVGAGVVTWAGPRSGYGLLVEINHGDGMVTRYGHNKSLLVQEGDQVRKGGAIALMGSTGRSTGAHVHFEVLKQGQAVNPEKYIYRARR